MSFDLATFISDCDAASREPDAQVHIEALLRGALEHADELGDVLAGHSDMTNLEDLVVHRTERLTILHGLIPPGFSAAPHNHNLWSIIAVYDGQEDNVFYERDGDSLVEVRRASVLGPDLLVNDADVIHSIANPRDTVLRAIHIYGGDLLATRRSNWDAETLEESEYDWSQVSSQTRSTSARA